MRADAKMNFKCSNCGETLEIDGDTCRLQFHSAYEINVDISVKPCQFCMRNFKEPIELLKTILKPIIEEVIKGKILTGVKV